MSDKPALRDPARALREAARDVIAAYDFCRTKGSFSGFWTHIDDLAKALDAYPLDVAASPGVCRCGHGQGAHQSDGWCEFDDCVCVRFRARSEVTP